MNTENTEIYVARTLEAGVEPIELRFLPMYDCYEHRVIGYTGRALINSVLYGTLTPKDYWPALKNESTGAELAVRCLKNTAAALLGTSADLSGLEYAGVLCPPSALTDPRLYDRLAGLAAHKKYIWSLIGRSSLLIGSGSAPRFRTFAPQAFRWRCADTERRNFR